MDITSSLISDCQEGRGVTTCLRPKVITKAAGFEFFDISPLARSGAC